MMKFDITQFKQQLSQYEAACGIEEPESILDFLFYWYSDTLFDRISDLCLSYQRAAFLEGLRTGYHLHRELGT